MLATDPVSRAIQQLADRRDLPVALAEEAFAQVMRGESSSVQMAAMLAALRAKGETADEVVGAVRALREAMIPVPVANGGPLVDTCGTGGGSVGTFNISTAAAFVAAGAGARVAKHGNRSFSSQSGSADLLEALGVTLPEGAEAAAGLLERCGMTFLFAPTFHPAMRHAGPVRRELGITTIMNLLGPLANPARVARQVVGVADPARAPLLAAALARLGTERALVVHARAGLDEIAPLGQTDVWEVQGSEVRTWVLDPASLELPGGTLEDLHGGTPAENAETTRRILGGADTGARRAAVLLNAAAALIVGGLAPDWKGALAQAAAAVDGGAARRVLDRMVEESRR
jgi:anthranilate phosphoribosyltransferase